MSTVVHVMRVSQDETARYSGSFPDVPGVSVEARTLSVLAVRARVALIGELQRLQAAGLDWPAASTLAAMQLDAGSGQALMLMIEAPVDDPPVRINISMGERLMKRLDAAASAQDMSRSGFIAAAVRDRLGDESTAAGEGSVLQRLYDEIGRVGGRVNEALGPASDLSRLVSELDKGAEHGWRTISSLINKSKASDG